MKISQMLLGAIAFSIGATVIAADLNSENQTVSKCTLPPTKTEMLKVDNDTTKKQTKPISDKVKQTQKEPQHISPKQLPEPKTHKLERPKKNKEPMKVEPISPEYCPACGMG